MAQVVKGIVLGSSSVFRKQLLESTGLKFTCASPEADEKLVQNSDPKVLAEERSVFKALDVSKKSPDQIVIGSDQTLEFEGKQFGKADDVSQARERLRMFSGKEHFLHSGVALVLNGKVLSQFVVTATIQMRELKSEELEAYLKTGEWRGCVGCYRFEEKGSQLFEKVIGDHSTIVGLPLIQLCRELRKFGVNPLLQPAGPWYLV